MKRCLLLLAGVLVACGCDKATSTTQTKTGAAKTGAEKASAAGTKHGQEMQDVKVLVAAKAYFSATEKLTFAQIDHDLQIYKTLHNGYPKSWEEFDKEILQPAHLKLPPLPEGKQYQFDSKTGQLMIAPAE